MCLHRHALEIDKRAVRKLLTLPLVEGDIECCRDIARIGAAYHDVKLDLLDAGIHFLSVFLAISSAFAASLSIALPPHIGSILWD